MKKQVEKKWYLKKEFRLSVLEAHFGKGNLPSQTGKRAKGVRTYLMKLIKERPLEDQTKKVLMKYLGNDLQHFEANTFQRNFGLTQERPVNGTFRYGHCNQNLLEALSELFQRPIQEIAEEKEYYEAIPIENKSENYEGRIASELLSKIKNEEWFLWKEKINKEDDPSVQLEMYQRALVECPRSHELMHGYASLCFHLEKYDLTKEYFIKALELYPQEPNYNSNYGLFLHQIEKNYDLAEFHFQKALKISPKHPNNNAHYAFFLHFVRSKFVDAEEQYKIALSINPDNHYALCNYAVLLQEKFDIEGAQLLYKRVLMLQPFDADAAGNYATLLAQWEIDRKMADFYFNQAIALDPTGVNKHANYSQLLFSLNRTAEALKHIENATRYLNGNESTLLTMLFYLYAHYPDKREDAETQMEVLLKKKVKSLGHNLSINIKAALTNQHPFEKKLLKYAEAISGYPYDKEGNMLINKI